MALIWSYSAWVIAPLSSRALAFSISAAPPPPATSRMYCCCACGLLHVPLGHRLVLRDQVDEDAEERQDDHEDDPEHLRAAADVAAPEDVDEDGDQEPEPDHPEEEHEHRPHHVEKRIVSGQHRFHLLVAIRALAASVGYCCHLRHAAHQPYNAAEFSSAGEREVFSLRDDRSPRRHRPRPPEGGGYRPCARVLA